MSANRFNNDEFDEILEQALQSHSEPVPADFTARMLSRIKEVEQQRILAHIVWQERLALAGCIILGAATIISAFLFSDALTTSLSNIAAGLMEQKQALYDETSFAIATFINEWPLYLVFAGVFAFVVYSLVDLLAPNGEKKYLRIRNGY